MKFTTLHNGEPVTVQYAYDDCDFEALEVYQCTVIYKNVDVTELIGDASYLVMLTNCNMNLKSAIANIADADAYDRGQEEYETLQRYAAQRNSMGTQND